VTREEGGRRTAPLSKPSKILERGIGFVYIFKRFETWDQVRGKEMGGFKNTNFGKKGGKG